MNSTKCSRREQELAMALGYTHESNLLASILPKGRYEIRKLLGAGAFGQAYTGRDLLTGIPIVLKLLLLGTGEARARIHREIDVLKRMRPSPGVVSMIDAYLSPDGKGAVLVSEYIEGPTLEHLVERHGSGLPDVVIAAIARQLCGGLNHLHGQGIVHRDVKPSNIVIANDGAVKLLDFGIAVSIPSERQRDSTITSVGNFVGTMRYAAPEMLSGNAYGDYSDIYALGVTILFMLLGRQPFEHASFPFLVTQALKGEFISELPESLKSSWGGILSQVLDSDPEGRPLPYELRAMLEGAAPPTNEDDETIVAGFIQSGGQFREPPPNPPTAISSEPQPDNGDPLKAAIQSLAIQIHEVQAALADVTAIFRSRELVGVAAVSGTPALPAPEERIEATFATVRRRLELNWRISLTMTFTLFSLFVAMLVLAVVFGLVYEKSYWGLLFGGTSGLSLLTVLLWKPMDKMLFATIATQQLELVQLNYQRALSGGREERREAFRDVSTQLNALLTKTSKK